MWTYNYSNYEPELCHHGIKGQKWGIRRFQNKDGTLTKAGKDRYADDIERVKREIRQAKFDPRKVGKERARIKTDELEEYRDRSKMESRSSISKREQKLIDKYKSAGMTEDQAKLQAYRRARAEKTVAIVGGIALVAVTAYGVKKYRDNNVDRFLKGVDLHTIQRTGGKTDRDVYYAAYKKSDRKKYLGLYGQQLGGDIQDVRREINAPLKIASRKSAANITADLMKNDKEFRNAVKKQVDDFHEGIAFNPTHSKIIKKAKEGIEKGDYTKVYDFVNYQLPYHNNDLDSKIHSKVYSALKSKGYDAIQDLNDVRWSGYGSKDPVIVFNTGKTAVKSVTTDLGDKSLKTFKTELGKRFAIAGAKTVAYYGVPIYAGKKMGKMRKQSKDNKIIAEYKREHPNTNLSDRDILLNYYS